MKKGARLFLCICVGALIGALLCGGVVGVFLFTQAGPEYERTSLDASTKGLWPLASLVFAAIAAFWGAVAGAVVGAIVAAVRIRRHRLFLEGATASGGAENLAPEV